MSLLLDALKKAADDKKKVSQGNGNGSVSSDTTHAEAAATASVEEEAASGVTEELTLDPVEADITEPAEDAAIEAEMTLVAEPEQANNVAAEPSLKQKKNLNDTNTTSYTVSDEALSMLIYKTNRDVKQSKRLTLVSVLLVSLAILVSGGIYHYMDMQAEIATLDRKHQIAMHSMELKTNKEKIPDKSKIIRNLVGESDLDDKVQYAKKHMSKKKIRPVAGRSNVPLKNNKASVASPAVTFQKTNKTDPVAEKLEQAWLAYEGAKYDRAKKLYKEVLVIEKNNRDALLGLGAIAIIEKNNMAAREVYVALLKNDPRDSIAISALASLRNNAATTETDEKYLLSMLQKTPDDAHLNFALGNIYAQQGKWKFAQRSYFNAWQGDNENADYIFNLAVSMDQLGKQKQAVNFYQNSLTQSVNKQVAFSREAVKKRISELSGL